jgi:hypothetical protein
MADKKVESRLSKALGCCPDVDQKPVCDTLNFRYRIPFRPRVGDTDRRNVLVDVVLHFRFERCSEGLVVGDPIYSTTILPGERVRLFTSDRHTRFSYDSESDLSYRHQTTSVESFYTAGMAQSMSDLTINESGSSSSSYEESWAEGGGGASVSLLGLIEIGGGGGGGSYDSQSLSAFSHSLSQHAESASRYVAASVRAKSATSVGEVEQRQHAEGESEAHYESSSRAFHNPNKCHAVTYIFYQISKRQKIRFNLVAIERRVVDPAAPTGAFQRVPVDTTGLVSVVPQSIPATQANRLEIEQMARESALQRQQVAKTTVGIGANNLRFNAAFAAAGVATANEPISRSLREAALAEVDSDLIKAGLLDPESRKPSERFIAELSWEREEILPTPGVLVRGCLDECETCEPALEKEIELDLERKKLENKLLERQIELLEKSQEYRCCPSESDDSDED